MQDCKKMIVKMLKISIRDEIETTNRLGNEAKEVALKVQYATLENHLINQLKTLEDL